MGYYIFRPKNNIDKIKTPAPVKPNRYVFVKDDLLEFPITEVGGTAEMKFRLCNDTSEVQKVSKGSLFWSTVATARTNSLWTNFLKAFSAKTDLIYSVDLSRDVIRDKIWVSFLTIGLIWNQLVLKALFQVRHSSWICCVFTEKKSWFFNNAFSIKLKETSPLK